MPERRFVRFLLERRYVYRTPSGCVLPYAKEAFNELNVKKLPTIKELQTEYAQLLADKKKAYGEYRQARAAMRELLTVKNNVDRVLAMEQPEPQQKEKDHGQR